MEHLKRKHYAPVPFDAPSGEDLSSELEDYKTHVVVNKLTGAKRTRLVFDQDLDEMQFFYDTYLDRDASRAQIPDLGVSPYMDRIPNDELLSQMWTKNWSSFHRQRTGRSLKVPSMHTSSCAECSVLFAMPLYGWTICVAGSEIISTARRRHIHVMNVVSLICGLCHMRYRRDLVFQTLLTRLRSHTMAEKLTQRDLTNIVFGLGSVRYRDVVTYTRICTQFLLPPRLEKCTSGK